MRALTRYMVLEFSKVFLTALAAMTLLMLIVGVIREGWEEGLGLAELLRLIPYILPDALRFTVPGTVLFATCSVFGRMSGSNEIVAIKSLGISPLAILFPILVLAFFLSLATLWLNDLAVSWGRNGVRRVVIEAVEEIAYGMLRVQRSYSTPQLSINVKRVDGRKLIQPTLTFKADADSPSVTVRAAEAELRADPDSNVLTITCTNGTVDVDGEATLRFPDIIERQISLEDFSTQKNSDWSPSWMPMRVIAQKTQEQEAQIEACTEELAAKAGYAMLTGNLDALANREWSGEEQVLANLTYVLHRLRTEPARRWSTGFSCLCFVLVGAPMAIRLRNADFLTSFFACFLPILVVYYPLLMYGVGQAKNGSLPPVCVWLGNVILAVWGLWLLRKVVRY